MARSELNQVQKKFGDTEVIPLLDLQIEDGEFGVFVGPSGCSKSTLLRLIAGHEGCDPMTVRAPGDVTVSHGDTLYLTPQDALIHRFGSDGLRMS